MLRIYKDNFVPKYKSGRWTWDEVNEKFKYVSKELSGGAVEADTVIPIAPQTSFVKFRPAIDQVEELIFRKVFERPSRSFDSDVICIQDLKNLVLFLAPPMLMSKTFVKFVHTITMDKFLNALIIYFEYFLKAVEFIIIKRDELKNERLIRLQCMESVENYVMLSEYLSQYRIMLGREYAKIVLGTHDVKKYHHVKPICNFSNTSKDCKLHENFLSFSTQVAWIAHHRRAFRTIDAEVNRLFRSKHFDMTERGNRTEYFDFTRIEEEILYGKNYKKQNFRQQISPIIQEISKIEPKNMALLWIGEKKYNGNDSRVLELEIEFAVPESQLSLIDIPHGILGHPKLFYNTMLALDWTVIRQNNFNDRYDPYRLFKQPFLRFPDYKKFVKQYKSLEPLFALKDVHYEKEVILKQRSNWLRREKIVRELKKHGLANDVILFCRQEVEAMGNEIVIERDKIIKEFLEEKAKLRK